MLAALEKVAAGVRERAEKLLLLVRKVSEMATTTFDLATLDRVDDWARVWVSDRAEPPRRAMQRRPQSAVQRRLMAVARPAR